MFQRYVHVTVDRATELDDPPCPSHVTMSELTPEDCLAILEHPARWWRMIPTGMIVIGLEPMEVHPINFDHMMSDVLAIYASTDVSSGDVTSLSFGTGFRCPTEFLYECDIYTSTGDVMELAHHVWKHLAEALKLNTENKLKITIFVQHDDALQGITDIMRSSSNAASFQFSKVSNHVVFAGSLRPMLKEGYQAMLDYRTVKSNI